VEAKENLKTGRKGKTLGVRKGRALGWGAEEGRATEGGTIKSSSAGYLNSVVVEGGEVLRSDDRRDCREKRGE